MGSGRLGRRCRGTSALPFCDVAGGAGLLEVGFAGSRVALELKDGLMGFNNFGTRGLGDLGVSEAIESG